MTVGYFVAEAAAAFLVSYLAWMSPWWIQPRHSISGSRDDVPAAVTNVFCSQWSCVRPSSPPALLSDSAHWDLCYQAGHWDRKLDRPSETTAGPADKMLRNLVLLGQSRQESCVLFVPELWRSVATRPFPLFIINVCVMFFSCQQQICLAGEGGGWGQGGITSS